MHARLESYLGRIARVLARTREVRVVVSGTRGPCTDLKTLTIYLPATAEYLQPQTRWIFEGFIDHEAGHVRAEVEYDVPARVSTLNGSLDPLERYLLNIVEDVRIENEASARWPGAAVNLERMFRYLLARAAESHERDPCSALYMIGAAFIARARALADTVAWMPHEVHEVLDDWPDLVAAAAAARTPLDSRDVAVELARRMRSAGVEISNPSLLDGRHGDDPEAPDKLAPTTRRLLDEALGEDPDDVDTPMHDAGDYLAEMALSDAMAAPTRRLPHPRAVALDTCAPPITPPDDHDLLLEDARRSGLAVVAGLSARLLALLRASVPIPRYDSEEGDLDPAVLTRLSLGDDRVFVEAGRSRETSAAMTVLFDRSGSMGDDDKIRLARHTAYALGETMSWARIPCELLAWDNEFDPGTEAIKDCSPEELALYTRFEPLRMLVLKAFSEAWPAVAHRVTALVPGEDNDDAEAVAFAARRLEARREKLRILIVVSDGLPHHMGIVGKCDGAGMVAAQLVDAIARAERSGLLVGAIGLRSPHASRFYRFHERADVVADLPARTLRLVRRLLMRSSS